jgi:2-haloacid dehalogenase
VTLYGLSNWPAQIWPPRSHPESAVQHDYEFLDIFKDIVVSGIEQMKKPSPDIYNLALDRWGVTPEPCIFIDDLMENIDTANSLDILGHHFVSSAKLERELLEHDLL